MRRQHGDGQLVPEAEVRPVGQGQAPVWCGLTHTMGWPSPWSGTGHLVKYRLSFRSHELTLGQENGFTGARGLTGLHLNTGSSRRPAPYSHTPWKKREGRYIQTHIQLYTNTKICEYTQFSLNHWVCGWWCRGGGWRLDMVVGRYDNVTRAYLRWN